MIDFAKILIIIGLVIAIVLLFNFALIARLKTKPKGNENNATQSMLNSIKSPWKEEVDALDELANLVRPTEDQTKVKKDS